jgi:hypothetical protein
MKILRYKSNSKVQDYEKKNNIKSTFYDRSSKIFKYHVLISVARKVENSRKNVTNMKRKEKGNLIRSDLLRSFQ